MWDRIQTIAVLQVLVAAWLPFLFFEQGAETRVAAIVTAVIITLFLVPLQYMPAIPKTYYTGLVVASLFILGIVGFILSSLWIVLVFACVAVLALLLSTRLVVPLQKGAPAITVVAFMVMAWSTTLSGILAQQPVSAVLFLVNTSLLPWFVPLTATLKLYQS